MHIRSLNDAPSATDYLKRLECEESSREFRPVMAGTLQLTAGGLLQVCHECRRLIIGGNPSQN